MYIIGCCSHLAGRIHGFDLQGLASLASLAFGGQAAQPDIYIYIGAFHDFSSLSNVVPGTYILLVTITSHHTREQYETNGGWLH